MSAVCSGEYAFKVRLAQGYKYYIMRVGSLQRLKGDRFEHNISSCALSTYD